MGAARRKGSSAIDTWGRNSPKWTLKQVGVTTPLRAVAPNSFVCGVGIRALKTERLITGLAVLAPQTPQPSHVIRLASTPPKRPRGEPIPRVPRLADRTSVVGHLISKRRTRKSRRAPATGPYEPAPVRPPKAVGRPARAPIATQKPAAPPSYTSPTKVRA